MKNTVSRNKASIVAGGAGFIGSNLLLRLLDENRDLVVIDNMSRGNNDYIRELCPKFADRIRVVKGDLADRAFTLDVFNQVCNIMNVDEVWHLAANSDIAAGVLDPEVDLKDTFMTTFNILAAMEAVNVKIFHFASSSAIYGDMGDEVISESCGPLLPISNYGAMKLASEGLISAAFEKFLEGANIFRFPNVVGTPATHGVIFDLINKIKKNKDVLNVLGDGTQQKPYLHVEDLVDAMMHIRKVHGTDKLLPINIGPSDPGVSVKFIAETVVRCVDPKVTIQFGIGNKGWKGDVPRFKYSTERLNSTGWMPRYSSEAAIVKAVEQICRQLIPNYGDTR